MATERERERERREREKRERERERDMYIYISYYYVCVLILVYIKFCMPNPQASSKHDDKILECHLYLSFPAEVVVPGRVILAPVVEFSCTRVCTLHKKVSLCVALCLSVFCSCPS